MIIVAYIPLLFAILGMLIYVLASNHKMSHLGDVLFWTGWLVTMLTMAKHVFRLG